MKNIIAIQGYKNSGKNEVASMLQFLLNSPTWQHSYFIYNLLKKYKKYSAKQYQIVSYAEKLKQATSVLLGVPVEKFEDRNFKENYYVDFTTLDIFEKVDITNTKKILSDAKFSKEVKKLDPNLTSKYFLSIRQVLQYLGTEIIRHYVGNDFWIMSAYNSTYQNIIIPDQRFMNEYYNAANNGAIIYHITRPGCIAGTHASEAELKTLEADKMYDYLIENNGSLQDLFNICKYTINQQQQKALSNGVCSCKKSKQNECNC